MTSRVLAGRIALACGMVSIATMAQATMDKPVKTQKGLVAGAPGKLPGITVFKGIPFGAPPVGALRWKAPQPVAAWKGVRPGTAFGKACMQPRGEGRINISTDMPDSPGLSEDCLYLNVWTPAKAATEKRPVMVWIYGGAYYEGAGSNPNSEGDQLAAKGVVLVSFNYRLGALGFLAHPELTAESPHKASGNYALMDAIEALKWVKANIAAFGGDPDNVTIFGESAGAAISGGLTGSPLAKGLYHRAIAESGAWMGLGIAKMRPLASAEEQTVKAAETLGKANLAALRAMPAEEASAKLPRQGMIIDGWVVPEDLSVTFAEGRQNAVDVIVGSNGEEGSFSAAFGPPMTLAAWNEGAEKRWGSLAASGMAAYPAKTDAEAKAAAVGPFSDMMAWHMRLFGDAQARIGKQAWLYHFTHKPPYPAGTPDLGAVHTAEIPYVFNNLGAARVFPDSSSPELASKSASDRALADQMSTYWVNFAKSGNPNGGGLPAWPTLKALGPTEAMLLDGKGSGRGPWLSAPKVDFYSKMYDRDVAAK